MIREQYLVALSGALFVTGAAVQPAAAQLAGEQIYIPAEVVTRAPPNYPAAAEMSGREGWAIASFIISEQGEVIEPMIERSSSPEFDAPTLRAIKSWRYKPATIDGKPVEESMVQTIIHYQLQANNGTSSQFAKRYRAVYAMVFAKKLAEADPLIQALAKDALNSYEEAWMGWLKYVYLDAMGVTESAVLIDPLRKALATSYAEDEFLEPDTFVLASQRLYVLDLRSSDLSEAVATYKRLQESKSAKRSKLYEDAVASLERGYREIMNAVAGPKLLQQTARVDEHNYWVHRMLRRSFAFSDVHDGKLEVVDVRCTRANRRFTAMRENAVLKIPDSWGDCSVYMKGAEGTTFVFAEYPAGYANAVEPAQVAPTNQ